MLEGSRLLKYLPTVIIPAIWVTLKIIAAAAVFSIFFGIILGTILVVTGRDGLLPNKVIHFILEKITDIIRSFPTMILIVALIPVTRAVIGTSIGTGAAIFAITVGCTPFAARMTETALLTVDSQLIRAAQSMGASNFQILTKVMLVEALPVLVSNFTIMLINMLNMSAMAGALGAGGLGAVALTYGYQRFDDAIMYFVVAILIVIVLIIQKLATLLYKKLK
ncbi:MAG: methionine ABC transporter permease [Muricomes sp.]